MELFHFLSAFSLVTAIQVIQSANPVMSVLYLILTFCNAAGLLILVDADFFAMLFLVVYVGAIAVLFLFVVMMLNIQTTEKKENSLSLLPIGGLVGFFFVCELFYLIENNFVPFFPIYLSSSLQMSDANANIEVVSPQFVSWSNGIQEYTNIEAIGLVLYTDFFVYFLLASLVLLVAMIGAIVLTMHKRLEVKKQIIFEQNARELSSSIQKIVV